MSTWHLIVVGSGALPPYGGSALICNVVASLDEGLEKRGRCYHNKKHDLQSDLLSSWCQAYSVSMFVPELRVAYDQQVGLLIRTLPKSCPGILLTF